MNKLNELSRVCVQKAQIQYHYKSVFSCFSNLHAQIEGDVRRTMGYRC